MGFDTQDLLRQDGFEEGDFVPLATHSTRSQSRAQTSSDSFTNTANINEFIASAEKYPGTGIAYRVRYFANGNGDVARARMINRTDIDPLTGSQVDIASSSFTLAESGVNTYNPPTTTSQIRINAQLANSDNSTTVELLIAQIEVGVIL